MGFGAYLVGVAFWVFVGAVAVAQIMADHQKRRMNVDLLRTIIEKGQSIDPALVAKLMAPDAIEERTDPQDVRLGGIITTAVGVGVALLSYFIAQIAPIAFYPILGGGVVVICIGAGLLIGAKAMANARARERTDKSAP
jgi:Domain of unknown function (DUF6249)